jgi:gas vesicle structural protein
MTVATQRAGGGGGHVERSGGGGGSSGLADVIELILDKGLVI